MNCDNSDEVWCKPPTIHQMENYYLKQYEEEYESIKFIKGALSKLKFNTAIDFGCGSGALIYYLKKKINAEYSGIDFNETVLKIAIEKNRDCIFINDDFKNLSKTYDLTISSMVLMCMSPKIQNTLINKQFQSSEKYAVFFSLFTDSKLDINIKIKDPYNNEVVYYNILPVDKLIDIANKHDFNILKNDKFNIEKHINKEGKKGRGTYTVETNNHKLLQFSDVIYMPWKLIIFEKT
uniref:Methyltransferase domain-containing protein n=1 Tax=viral metagenome TaxID=1070528 RepID=A0A6C0C312_9ZZZZ